MPIQEVFSRQFPRLRNLRLLAFGDIAILVFVTAQVLDGALTYAGVSLLGLHMEGNPLIASLIERLGIAPAIATAKGMALGLGAFLHLMAVHRVIVILAGLYFAAAVLPWTRLLFFP